jgi:pilus assembly protein Flp/PilA
MKAFGEYHVKAAKPFIEINLRMLCQKIPRARVPITGRNYLPLINRAVVSLLFSDRLRLQYFSHHNSPSGIKTNSSSYSLRQLQLVRRSLLIPTGTKDRRIAEDTDTQESHMKNLVAKFASDESGATAIEYGLIAALIAVAMIVGAGKVGTAINTKFTTIATKVGSA